MQTRAAAAPAHGGHEAPAPVPGRRTLVEQAYPWMVQRVASADADPDAIHAAAQRGVATPATALPFGQTIQRLFGRHDISQVQAHTGTEAGSSARAMGATAYATGHHVVLGSGTDLHTVAHEAAHVVQQRAGIQLRGGVGEAGDPHEQHANAVADGVVRGESVEHLLDRHGGGGGAAPAIQRQWVGTRVVEDEEQHEWRQTTKDEDTRDNGWYRKHDGDWQLVEAIKLKRKHESSGEKDKDKDKNKDSPSAAKKPKPKLDPKVQLPRNKSVQSAMSLVQDSEVGKDVLNQALEVSKHLEIELGKSTQTHLDYGGDRKGVDTIELSKDRMLVQGVGSVAQQLVMELCNLSNKLRFWEADYDAQNGKLDQEAYVELNERIEYDAALKVYGAWAAAQATPNKEAWGKSNHNPELLKSWETWWDHMQRKNQPHLDVYRRGWTWLLKDGAKRMPVPPTREPPPTSVAPETPSDQPQGGLKLVDYEDD